MNQANFEQFYRKNIDRIYRYVYFRVGHHRQTAEDLVGEIFLKALRAFDSFDENISQTAWIYRIAHNHLANHWRDRREQVSLEGIEIAAADSIEVDNLALEQAFSLLDSEEKSLVTMRYLEGYKYSEMAEILGRSAGALRIAVHRAINKLKRGER